MADHAGDLGVDQLLCDGGSLLGVSLVVFGNQFELDLLAVDHDALGVGVVDRQARTVFVVLTQVGLRSGGRADVPDLHGDFRHGRRGCRRDRLRFFLAATVDGQQCRGDERKPERAVECHGFPPRKRVTKMMNG